MSKLLTWGSPSNQPVLLCHGKQDVASSYRPLLKHLPENFFYVSIDLPGNGHSDCLPKGVAISIFDLMPSVKFVVDYFKWTSFIFIGHSWGVSIGKYFTIFYPGLVSKLVELDPTPAYRCYRKEILNEWYIFNFAQYYDEEKYKKYNSSIDTAPKYTYEEALKLIMDTRNLERDAAEIIAERALVSTENGLYRFTFDQRLKTITSIPFSKEYIKDLYTSLPTPTLCILTTQSIKLGLYKNAPFVLDEKSFKHNNHRVVVVDGYHDVHVSNPERVADAVCDFLNNKLFAKL